MKTAGAASGDVAPAFVLVPASCGYTRTTIRESTVQRTRFALGTQGAGALRTSYTDDHEPSG